MELGFRPIVSGIPDSLNSGFRIPPAKISRIAESEFPYRMVRMIKEMQVATYGSVHGNDNRMLSLCHRRNSAEIHAQYLCSRIWVRTVIDV